ncbi:MAG: amidohydrolase family protein [Acidobacteriota bacterium]
MLSTLRAAALLALLAASLAAQTTTAFTRVRLIDGTSRAPIENATLLVREGKIIAAGPASSTPIPRGAQTTRLAGKTIIPGLVNAHAHVTRVSGPPPPLDEQDANLARQLSLYARYGITTLWSLGGEDAASTRARAAQDAPTLNRARIYFAGPVITATTPEAARTMVHEVAALKPDIIKIRVDDNLGASRKMTPAVYRAVIDEAHRLRLRVAVHIYYLDDAKDLLRSGADYIAHSVRDRDVDDEFITLMKQRDICYCPTLTRELSTYVYESVPAFFKDPFFLREADAALVAQLKQPERQAAIRASKSAQTYKAQLPVAMRNLKKVSDAGIRIAMGTDTGALPERFQGYFEHLELDMIAQAGLTNAQVLRATTSDAAACMNRPAITATLVPNAPADFLVLGANPLTDIRNIHKLDSVWIAGNRVPSPPH